MIEEKESKLTVILSPIKLILEFLLHLKARLSHDRLQVNAGYMAYVTLLSIVPLVTVLLSALSMIPGIAETGDSVKNYVLENFVPASSEVLSEYLDQFVANAGKMTAVGVIFLFVVALMLISAIDNSLNYIWRVQKKRAKVVSFSLYWMVLTLGPVFVGGSLAVSSYLSSLNMFDPESSKYIASTLLRILPYILTAMAFLGLYTFVPNTKVAWVDAFVGAISASLLFEFSKKVFAYYIVTFPSYELIYGALATIPILFVWVYLSWIIVLLGAEITAALGEFRHTYRLSKKVMELPKIRKIENVEEK